MGSTKEIKKEVDLLESNSKKIHRLFRLSLAADGISRFAGKSRGFEESLRGLALDARALLWEVQRNRSDGARRGGALEWDGVAARIDLLVNDLVAGADAVGGLAELAEEEVKK